jgi:hypothetical protein
MASAGPHKMAEGRSVPSNGNAVCSVQKFRISMVCCKC